MLKLLLEVKEYIEKTEVSLDYELGYSRDLDELIRDNMIPDLYGKVLEEIEKIKKNNKERMIYYGNIL